MNMNFSGDPKYKKVILTKQFRLPTFINGNDDGMMIEACAGLLNENNPENCIRKEVEEETGNKITELQKNIRGLCVAWLSDRNFAFFYWEIF